MTAASPPLRFDVITLFPELIEPMLSSGINRRAFQPDGDVPPKVQVKLWNPRDHASGPYRRVDDRPFGGGPGMVMLAQPLADCLAAVRADRPETSPVPVVLFSPLGERLSQPLVAQRSVGEGAVLICGRYEGLDQRFIDAHVTQQISLGDFVLSGGEIAAMALLDAVARLQPGVLGDADSHAQDSFGPALDGLLDCPHYTRPQQWAGQGVPPVLLSGHHAAIARWRRQQSLLLSAQHRPELLAAARDKGGLSPLDEAFLSARATIKGF